MYQKSKMPSRVSLITYLGLLTFCIFFCQAAICQATQDSIALAPVEITASRSPALATEIPSALSTVDEQDIQELKPTLSLEESLKRVPGVFINNRYNLAQGERISIRGLGSRAQFGVRGIKMVLDGIPLTFADGTTQLNTLDPSFIGHMEILRGPASTLYGNAAGGVIYLESVKPEKNKVLLCPRIIAGSFGFRKAQALLKVSSGRTSFLLSTDATDYRGYREFSESRLYHANSIITFQANATTRMRFILNGMYAPYMFSPGGLSIEEMEADRRQARAAVKRQVAGKEVLQVQSGLSLQKDFRKRGRLTTTLFGIQRNLYNPIFGRIILLDRLGAGLHTVYSKPFNLGKNSILHWQFGIDLEYQNDQRQEVKNPGLTDARLEMLEPKDRLFYLPLGNTLLFQREKITSGGAFTLLKWNIKKLSLSAGLRADHFDFSVQQLRSPNAQEGGTRFDWLSPSAGILYSLTNDWQSYANYSTGYQTPTANEYSNDPSGKYFNSSLKPEYVQSCEAGLKKYGRKLKGGLTAFYFTVKNQLIPYQISIQSDETFYRNAGKTSNRGVELWAQYPITSTLRLYGSYTYMHYVFEDYLIQSDSSVENLSGNLVPGVPVHQLFVEFDWHHSSGLSAEFTAQYVGNYFANDQNGSDIISVPTSYGYVNTEYLINDLRLGYSLEKKSFELNLFAGINNVFNVVYSGSIIPNAAGNRFFEPSPGRNYYLGMRIPLKLKK